MRVKIITSCFIFEVIFSASTSDLFKSSNDVARKKVVIIGSGNFGTTIAGKIARNVVNLPDYDKEVHMKHIRFFVLVFTCA